MFTFCCSFLLSVGRSVGYRLSMLDLVEEGSSWTEVVDLAKQIEAAGASIINTGIGWHEARVPTIATMGKSSLSQSHSQHSHSQSHLVTYSNTNTHCVNFICVNNYFEYALYFADFCILCLYALTHK